MTFVDIECILNQHHVYLDPMYNGDDVNMHIVFGMSNAHVIHLELRELFCPKYHDKYWKN